MRALLAISMVLLSCVCANSQGFIKRLFTAKPPPTLEQLTAEGGSNVDWDWRGAATIPALKLVESTRPDALLDGYAFTSAGGGITYQKLEWQSEGDDPLKGKWVSKFSWSPLTVLLVGNFDDNTAIDPSLATTVGFFQNLFMLGVGVDLGSVPSGRSRLFGALSININFNN